MKKDLEQRVTDLENRSRLLVGLMSEEVSVHDVLYALLDELGLEVWWKIEEATGRRILAFRKKDENR